MHSTGDHIRWLRCVQNRLEDAKKRKFQWDLSKFWGVSRQIFAGVEMSNLKKGSRPVDLNEKPQYMPLQKETLMMRIAITMV
jgi:hypothetical protein